MKARREEYSLAQILEAARSLFDLPSLGHPEYRRAICELIGRLRLDAGGVGDGTFENAAEVAQWLKLGNPWKEEA